MYYAEKAARTLGFDPAERTRVWIGCPGAATEFCQKLFHVDIRPGSIATYYQEAKLRAVQAQLSWGSYEFLARILTTQVTESEDYDGVISFLQQNCAVGPNSPFHVFSICIR